MNSRTAYTTHFDMQYIHCMHIYNSSTYTGYTSTVLCALSLMIPHHDTAFAIWWYSPHVLLLCVHDSLPNLLSPLALSHTQATIMRTDGSSNQRPSQGSIVAKESSCAKRGSAHAPRESVHLTWVHFRYGQAPGPDSSTSGA